MIAAAGTRETGVEWKQSFDLRGLEVFLAVCDTGTMVQAGERLGLTQAAVSQTVARLETALDVALLDRSVRPVRLTAAGTVLRERARLLLATARQTRQAVRHVGRASLPELRLALVNSFAGAMMPDFYHRLRAALPVERVALLSGLAPDNLRALAEAQVDAVITAEATDAAAELPSIPLLSEPFVAVVPAGTPPVAALAGLAARAPYIGYSTESVIGRLVRLQLRRLRIEVPEALVLDSSLCLMDIVADGHGWSIATPLCLLEGRADPARVAVYPIREPMSPRRLALYTRRHELGELGQRIAAIAVGTAEAVLPGRLAPYGDWLWRDIRLLPDAAAPRPADDG